MKSPARFDDCGFVDTNPVMKRFSDVIDGRCMEEFSFDADFADPLQQDATSLMSWWIYSFNHLAADAGTYYLQTWLTRRDDPTKTAQGKYELTLGPHTWSGYASDSTLDLAQSQGTTCSCAVNSWDYKETYLERLGGLPIEFEIAQLPGGSCSNHSAPASPCQMIPQEQYMSSTSSIEWSALFELQPGKTYEWTFRAYYQGAEAQEYDYPDPGMFVYLIPSKNVESVALESNEMLTTAVEEEDYSNIITEGQTISMNEVNFIEFTDPAKANSTTVLIQPNGTATIAVFTQHVPSEFMAHALRDVQTGDYIFPITPKLYIDKNDPTIESEPVTEVGDTILKAIGGAVEEGATGITGLVNQVMNEVLRTEAPTLAPTMHVAPQSQVDKIIGQITDSVNTVAEASGNALNDVLNP